MIITEGIFCQTEVRTRILRNFRKSCDIHHLYLIHTYDEQPPVLAVYRQIVVVNARDGIAGTDVCE